MFKVHVINRYYPPYHAVTGESAHELVVWLKRHAPEIDVSVAHVKVPYNEALNPVKPEGRLFQINTVYGKKNKLLRLLSNVVEGFRLVKLASGNCDMLISLTDPPLLNIWAGALCARKKVPWVYWSMDLYPHAFKAAHLVSGQNPLYRILEKSFNAFPPSMLIALGHKQADFLQSNWPHRVPQVVLPCGIHNAVKPGEAPPWKTDDRLYFAYAGNMGEAHDPDFVIELVKSLDPAKHCCLLAIHGAKARKVLEATRGNPAVKIVPSLTKAELGHVDIHLVSLLDEWKHVCVPSKAVSAVCAGQAIIFHGARDSDTWNMLGSAGWIIDGTSAEDRMLMIREILAQAGNHLVLEQKKCNARSIRCNLLAQKDEALGNLLKWIVSNARSKEKTRQHNK